MKHRLAFAMSVLFISGCAMRRTPAFTSTWMRTDENTLADLSVENLVYVTTDRARFRIQSRGNGQELLQIYDGRDLLTRRYLTDMEDVEVATSSETVQSSSSALVAVSSAGIAIVSSPSTSTVMQTTATVISGPIERSHASRKDLDEMRFWIVPKRGASEIGAMVAGRPTRLYHFEERHGDTLVRHQTWIDADTSVALRSSVAIYSISTNSLIMRTTYDCLHLEYRPVADSNFQGS